MASGENLGSSDSGLAWGQGTQMLGSPPRTRGSPPARVPSLYMGLGGAEMDWGNQGVGRNRYLFTP